MHQLLPEVKNIFERLDSKKTYIKEQETLIESGNILYLFQNTLMRWLRMKKERFLGKFLLI